MLFIHSGIAQNDTASLFLAALLRTWSSWSAVSTHVVTSQLICEERLFKKVVWVNTTYKINKNTQYLNFRQKTFHVVHSWQPSLAVVRACVVKTLWYYLFYSWWLKIHENSVVFVVAERSTASNQTLLISTWATSTNSKCMLLQVENEAF